MAKTIRRNMLAVGEEVGVTGEKMLEASARVGARFHNSRLEVAGN